ncbi:hypothetical protein C8J57DRAFT_1534542 [Mycena rebaudengoi]|nr:hypothetical protein C8J57DRAFT_1534542 [Mycena rebaudengoi]
MAKRKNESHYDLAPESDDEMDSLSDDEGGPAVTLTGQILQETFTSREGRSTQHIAKMVPVPASPSKAPRTRAADLLPDEDWGDEAPPHYEPREPGAEYDASDSDSDNSGDEGGRELRESDHPLKQWVLDHRDEFLDELLRWEGRGDHRIFDICPACTVGNKADHRCTDCLPLHRVQRWTGDFFERKTLCDLGLRIQLGHWDGREHRCAVPTKSREDIFVIVDDHGVHEVSLDFCGCGRGGSHTRQLLRAGLYPATTTNPRTAATFSVLRRFHLLSFESKCSSYEFYHSLAREKDNTGLQPPRNRYHEWRRMTREWRNLQMLKRSGRGHDPTGPAGTKPGACALLCPACPQPGKNLPEDWQSKSEDQRFLYALFLAMDANFRLKRKDVSSEEKDPGLGPGWAFFCEVNGYMAHVEEHRKIPQERSRCVAHDAVDRPDKESCGTVSSGICAVDCARHNMKRPSAVGDLQQGERYINVDYMFFGSIEGTELQRFYVSYDIACQWHINLWARMVKYKPEIHFTREGKFMVFLVPKFHLPAHIESCNVRFSFNLTRYVGQTDGEAPERGWANANPLAGSTKEMGPGSRRDHLDDHFNDWNYKKIVAFGRMMLRKMQEALPEMVESRLALREMEATLGNGVVVEWTGMAEAWEQNAAATPNLKPNPFETVTKDTHLSKVRLDLAQEAADREAAGTEDEGAVRADMHITEWIAMGVQLKEQQRLLGFDVASTGLHPTDTQRRVMIERTSKLRRKILAWMVIQTQFFPAVTRIRELEDLARMRAAETQVIPGILVHNMALWLPSALMGRPGATMDEAGCRFTVLEAEYRLRVGEAHEALHDIRRYLLVRTHLYKFKDGQVRGVRDNMRSQDKIDALDEQVRRAAARYRSARRALVVLGRVLERREWEVALRPLAAEDVRGMPRAHFGDEQRQAGKTKAKDSRTSAKRRKVAHVALSWIWLVQKKSAEQEDEMSEAAQQPAMDEALRIEWAKTRARSMRWLEEVQLLQEEMRRIKQFLLWHSSWWAEQVGRRAELVDVLQAEGDRAYALRQAALKAGLSASFARCWEHLTKLVEQAQAGADIDMDELGGQRIEEAEEEDVQSEEGLEDDPVPASARRAARPILLDM